MHILGNATYDYLYGRKLNGRIDRNYMFNDHFIRGKDKMNMMLTLSFIIILTKTKGHIKNKKENIRGLINKKIAL